MLDEVEIRIAEKSLSRWKSYSISADLYAAAGQFSFEIYSPDDDLTEGVPCIVKVDGETVITGLMEEINEKYSHSESAMSLSGRDLMGLVVDEHCEEFTSYEGKTLEWVADRLLQNVPLINRKAILFGDGAQRMSVSKRFCKVEPGMTVHQVLAGMAMSRGLLFHCRADGVFEFVKPKESGVPAFALVRRYSGSGNNIESGTRRRSVAQRWRTVKVVGQQQGDDSFGGADEVNVEAVVTDESHPLSRKSFVVQMNDDGGSAQHQAKLILGKQRRESFQLTYRTPGHTQNRRIWAVNEICMVDDERFGIRGAFPIISRRLAKSKQDGTYTEVTLGKPVDV